MNQKIEIPIKNLVIKKRDLEDIAKYIHSLADEGKIEYIIKFKNDIELTSEDLEWINDRKIEEHEIKQVKMLFDSKDYKKHICLSIYNYDMWELSYIQISSDDEKWLAQMEFKIREIFSFCENGNKVVKFLKKYEIISITIVVILGFLSTSFWVIFLGKITSSDIEKIQFSAWFFDFLIVYTFLYIKLNKAFPSIELDISNKTNKSKKRRAIITGIFSTTILPIAVNIIYDLIKG